MRTALAVIALVIATLAGAAPAQADQQLQLNRETGTAGCADWQDWRQLQDAETKGQVQRIVGARGYTVERDLASYWIKRYPFCGHPYGWLAVGYWFSRADGWMVRRAVLVERCTHQSPADGPIEHCDPHSLTLIEAGLLA